MIITSSHSPDSISHIQAQVCDTIQMAAASLLTLPPNSIHVSTDVVPEGRNSFLPLSNHTATNNATPADKVLEGLLSSHGRSVNANTIPTSKFSAQIHPLAEEVGSEVEQYFLSNWNFKTEKERSTFLKAGFPKVTCLYFPEAKYDRIGYACRLLTILFLIDG